MEWKLTDEDVWFEFRGSRPQELTPGRYYRGVVDGYADFGVFVDIGDSVTGLLHRSELDRRLETLDWEPGDEVFVQVKGVRDNGDVDLAWSLRQSGEEFRGARVDDPEADEPLPMDDEDDTADDHDAGADSEDASESTEASEDGDDADPEGTHAADGAGRHATGGDTEANHAGDDTDTAESETHTAADPTAVERVAVGSLEDRFGDRVRIEGAAASVHQTSGPTIFEVRDETGTVECAAFEAAGVRAYPDVDAGDVVRLVGEVERRHGDIQVETEHLTPLEDDEAETIRGRLDAAMAERARPDEIEPFVDLPAIGASLDGVESVATTIRRAVMEERPIVIRHPATAGGYLAGAAIERAVLPEIRATHGDDDAEYHFVERRPMEGPAYGVGDATRDVTSMLDSQARHDESFPLVVLAGAGSTTESTDAYELLDVYDVERAVIDAGHPDPEITESVTAIANPTLAGSDDADARDLTTTALAVEAAAAVEPDVRADLDHLPATSYWEDPPAAYTDLAADAGVDAATCRDLREAVAFEAHFQSYDNKRELVEDLLFEGETDLAAHVADQFRDKLEDEVTTARHNLSRKAADGATVAVLDTDAFTHRYDFPPTPLLLDEIHRHERAETDDTLVTVGLGTDELHLRSTAPVDARAVGEAVAEAVPDAGVGVVGGRDGHLEFLSGERERVLEATITAVVEAV